MADVQEVRPEAIDVPEVISGADRWLAEQRARVAEAAAEYVPHEITSAEDYRESKRARTQARRAIREVEDARRDQVGAIKDAVRGFEAEVRDLLAPLSGIDDGYKAELAEWERLTVEARTQEVEAWYAETQGDVAQLVPFKALWDRFAAEGKWGLYGTNEEAIKQDVERRVEGVERDLETIGTAPYDAGDKDNVKAEYLRTLDLSGALRAAEEARRRRERMAEVEAERAKREAEEAEAERAWREAQAAQEPPCGPEAARTDICPQAPPAPATGAPVAPRQAPPAGPAPEPPADLRGQRVRTLVFEVEVPEHRAREFVAAMRAIGGVHGRKVGER